MQSVRLKYLFALLLLQWTASAQWRGPQLTRLGPSEGLPTAVLGMTQDSTGYLYLGSHTGLYRYDGNTFEFFGHNPLDERSIGPGDVYSVRACSDGLVWMTLRFEGLNSFDPKTGTFRHFPFPEVPYPSVPGAHALYEDSNGYLWVGGAHFRLYRFDKKTGTYICYIPDWIDPAKDSRRLNILSIYPHQSNPHILWLSVLDYASEDALLDSYGLVSFDTRTNQFQDYPCSGFTKYIDDQGVLWGTYWGNRITRFDPVAMTCDTFQYQYLDDGKLAKPLSHDILATGEDLLISTSRALLKYDRHKSFEIYTRPNLSDEIFGTLFPDRSGNLWISSNQGAYVLNPNNQHIRFFSLSQFGCHDRIYPGKFAFHSGENAVFILQTNTPDFQNIYVLPLDESRKNSAYAIQTGMTVQGIACDHRERIWVNGNGDMYLLDLKTNQLSPTHLFSADHPVPAFLKMTGHHSGWIGGCNRSEFVWFHADSQNVRRLHVRQLTGEANARFRDQAFVGFSFRDAHSAFLWTDEVFLVDLISGAVQQLNYDGIFNPDRQDIQSVEADTSGSIWMSSFVLVGKFQLVEDSLVMLDAFNISDGLINPTGTEIHIDAQQRLWFFTISGMNCIDPVSRDIRFFGTKQGLPNSWLDPVQVLTVSKDRIATNCANGLMVFDPEALWNSMTPSSETVVIKQIRIAGDPLITEKSINHLGLLKLKPGYSIVDIEFQGLAYPTDHRMEYSYRVKGLQNDWISLGKNKLVTLPELSHGEYTLEVKTGRPISNSPVKSLSILITTPYYLRWWFIAAAFLSTIIIVLIILQWRIRRVRRQEIARAEINRKIAELELKALRSQMNPHFMFNSLNSIKNYILHAEPRLAAEYLSNFAHLIRMILQNSREKTITLKDELETLLLYIELEKLRFDDEFDFSYFVDDEIHLDAIRIPPMLLQPYIENAIWHGLMHKRSLGHLMLQFKKENKTIACIIDDDGIGRAKAQEMKSLSATRYKSMGMGITQDRIEIMNKMDALGITTEITDKLHADGSPAGTRIILRIPATAEIYS